MENNLPDNLKILDLVKTNGTESSSSSSAASNLSNTFSPTNNTTNENPKNYTENIDKNAQGNFMSNTNQFSSPASLLTNAGSPAAVLAVSGISATNLLITSSGALGISQIANLTASANNNLINSINNTNNAGLGNTSLHNDTSSSLVGMGNAEPPPGVTSLPGPLSSTGVGPKAAENYRSTLKALDFCYSDDQNIRFNMIDSINLCVTVIAYATHAYRANQMLTILDVIIPRYFSHLKQETDALIYANKSSGFSFMSQSEKMGGSHYHAEIVCKARIEFLQLQKVSVSLKTLANASDFLTRTYTGPRSDTTASSSKQNQSNFRNSHNRSPSIMPDEDSMR